MKQYYFAAASLPTLQFMQTPAMNFHEFVVMAKMNVSNDDLKQLQTMRLFYDIQNIRSLLKNESFDLRGNLNQVELEESIISKVGLPYYVHEFLDRYETKEQRLQHFPAATSAYFKNEISRSHGFLKQYLIFERAWRLVLTGLRAKKLGRKVEKEIQFEDPNDDLIAQLLAQKDSNSFIPPSGFHELLPIFEKSAEEPLELHKNLCEYRFNKITEMTGIDLFSISYILSYMALLIIAEKWIELDQKKGDAILSIANKDLA